VDGERFEWLWVAFEAAMMIGIVWRDDGMVTCVACLGGKLDQ
jgi:hypothetical protein